MNVLYFGMDGVYSHPPLATIIKAIRTEQNGRLKVAGVVLPASAAPNSWFDGAISLLRPERPQSDLPLIQPYLTENIIHLAWANNIPVYLVRGMKDAAVYSLIRDLQPDIACAACFPYRIPSNILSIPKHGFLNIHPSLLPNYRGPSPLFWIFRDGSGENSGVTLHWMNEGMDTGDILSQKQVPLPDGISGPEADQLCASVGGEMLVEGLGQIADGEAQRRPQPPGGSYQPQPRANDFKLDSQWSARRAFNFMRGTAEWNYPYTIEIGSRTVVLTKAESFDPVQTQAEPLLEQDGRYQIRFNPGVLTAY